jgi:hypothetical protein
MVKHNKKLFVILGVVIAVVLSEMKPAYALDVTHETGEEIEFFTPVASDISADSLVSDGDVAGEITHDGTITYFTINPNNTHEHLATKGYGLQDYSLSLSGKSLLKDLFDRISFRTYAGNAVVFDFDVWEDVTGDGLSRDDLFYAAGSEIPVGTSRQFYTTCATASGEHQVAYGAYAVNAPSGNIFRYSFGGICLTDASKTGSFVNAKEQYTAYSAMQYKVNSMLVDGNIVYADGFYKDSLPRKIVVLKRGYTVALYAETYGSFNSSGYVEYVPHFSWVDEDFKNERTDIKLFYDTYIDGNRALLVEVGGATDNSNIKPIVASDKRLGISSATYNLRSFLKSITANTVVSRYSYGKTTAVECFYRPIDRKILPKSNDSAAILEREIEQGQQTWYGLYSLPSDVMLIDGDSRYFDMDEEQRVADYIYKLVDFTKDGYIKVTFDIVAHDDTGASYISHSADNDIVVYYDLDKRVGDDMVIRGIYNY